MFICNVMYCNIHYCILYTGGLWLYTMRLVRLATWQPRVRSWRRAGIWSALNGCRREGSIATTP